MAQAQDRGIQAAVLAMVVLGVAGQPTTCPPSLHLTPKRCQATHTHHSTTSNTSSHTSTSTGGTTKCNIGHACSGGQAVYSNGGCSGSAQLSWSVGNCQLKTFTPAPPAMPGFPGPPPVYTSVTRNSTTIMVCSYSTQSDCQIAMDGGACVTQSCTATPLGCKASDTSSMSLSLDSCVGMSVGSSSTSSSGSSVGAAVGAVIGILVLGAIVVVVVKRVRGSPESAGYSISAEAPDCAPMVELDEGEDGIHADETEADGLGGGTAYE